MIRHALALVCFTAPFCLARAGQPDDVKATIAYVQKLQTNGGGFDSQALSRRLSADARLPLRAGDTSNASRALGRSTSREDQP